jgi:predicted MPP superfamily phosphohydrolase
MVDAMTMPRLPQLRVVHASDIHFGASHRFQPPITPSNNRPPSRGYPELSASILADLKRIEGEHPAWGAHQNNPLILALTGDLTDRASTDEFDQAAALVTAFRAGPVLGSQLTRETTFIVPGNHDAIYDEADAGRRWFPYSDFYESVQGHHCRPAQAFELTRVIDRIDTHGFVVAEVNTCFDIQKGTTEENRGHIDPDAIDRLRETLTAIPRDRLDRSIRIAMMHHHPVVLPALAEPGRGYDAVVNAQMLLAVFRDFGFHLLLHGHKHFPHTFSYDATCAWTSEPSPPMMVVAGGSAGSTGLPDADGATNTYNMIAVKWNPDGKQGRIRVETRGLVRFDERRVALVPGRWHWRTLRVVDRIIATEPPPFASPFSRRPYDHSVDEEGEKFRTNEYEKTRGNMLVAEVLPSLEPEQAYEVSLRVTPHRVTTRKVPTRVEWSPGPSFTDVVCCDLANNPSFGARFSYWDSMLVRATLHFDDSAPVHTSVYAHLPGWREPPVI